MVTPNEPTGQSPFLVFFLDDFWIHDQKSTTTHQTSKPETPHFQMNILVLVKGPFVKIFPKAY